MKIELPDDIKIKLDDATYALTKGLVAHAYSKVEETDTGFVYTVDFEKQP
jgi:hypothetical protein